MKKPFSVIFLGTPSFALPALQKLREDDAYSVDLVITQPDKPVGRKQVLTAPPVKEYAQKSSTAVWQPVKINKEWSGFAVPDCDFLVTAAYGQILSKEILDFPRIAAVNIHPSLLPRWRGAAPIQHAILAGDTETGVTIQVMSEQLDAGEILAQTVVPLSGEETAPLLEEQLAKLGATLLTETLKKELHLVKQDETNVTTCSKLSRDDGLVDPTSMTAEEIDRRVRALVPWPGVVGTIDSQELKILKTSLQETEGSVPITCKDNSVLHTIEVQPPGKKPMTAQAWKRGVKD